MTTPYIAAQNFGETCGNVAETCGDDKNAVKEKRKKKKKKKERFVDAKPHKNALSPALTVQVTAPDLAATEAAMTAARTGMISSKRRSEVANASPVQTDESGGRVERKKVDGRNKRQNIQTESRLTESKKKRKKKSKNNADDEMEVDATKTLNIDENFDDEDDLHTSENLPTLEGILIPGTMDMVLVDKTGGVVYSASERTGDNDAHLKIGNWSKEGGIVLTASAAGVSDDDKRAKREHDGRDPAVATFPYPVDESDHCETPTTAYAHIKPLLRYFAGTATGTVPPSAAEIGSCSPCSLSIYDPYYCDGGSILRLSSLGFPNVQNFREDCYAAWSKPDYDARFDILVTNPPYSGDHVGRLVKFLASEKFGTRPWMMLVPQWVHKKPYFTEAFEGKGCGGVRRKQGPFYLVPQKRYVYLPPKGMRPKKDSETHKKSAPFVSMWFVWAGTSEATAQCYEWLVSNLKLLGLEGEVDVARSKSALRDLRRRGSGKAKLTPLLTDS